jgi:hypothetical protein
VIISRWLSCKFLQRWLWNFRSKGWLYELTLAAIYRQNIWMIKNTFLKWRSLYIKIQIYPKICSHKIRRLAIWTQIIYSYLGRTKNNHNVGFQEKRRKWCLNRVARFFIVQTY